MKSKEIRFPAYFECRIRESFSRGLRTKCKLRSFHVKVPANKVFGSFIIMNSRVKIIKKRHFVQPNPNQQHQQLQTRQRPQQHGQQQQQQSNSSRCASTGNEDFFSPVGLWSWEGGKRERERESCEESASKKSPSLPLLFPLSTFSVLKSYVEQSRGERKRRRVSRAASSTNFQSAIFAARNLTALALVQKIDFGT